MADETRHPSDRDLLLLTDQQLNPRRVARVESHVDACAACQGRVRAMTRALASATESVFESAIPIPPAARARARLVHALDELRVHGDAVHDVGIPQWAVAAVATVAAVVGIAWLLARDTAAPPAASVQRTSPVFLLPKADLTPGLVRPVTVTEACGDERYGRTQPIPAFVLERVFARYGADARRSSEYELDYLITPELGGVADARNLWPQAFTGTAWNAYVKDELELHLHRLVCGGVIDFETAQRELATDWIAAYKRRFDTDKPLRDYAAAPLTEHDAEFLRAELEELGVAAPVGQADGPRLLALLQRARHETAMSTIGPPATTGRVSADSASDLQFPFVR